MQLGRFLVSKNIKVNQYTSSSPDPLVNAQLYDIPREDILSWIYLIPHVMNLNRQLTRITFPQLRE